MTKGLKCYAEDGTIVFTDKIETQINDAYEVWLDEVNFSDYSTIELYDTADNLLVSFAGKNSNEPIRISNLLLEGPDSQLNIGETEQIPVVIVPSNATDKNMEWYSSDSEIATVDNTGLVTALKPGTVTITATAKDGSNVAASCEITVTKAQQKLTGTTSYEKTYGEPSFNLDMELSEGDGDLTYESSDEEVVIVDTSGKVTVKGAGTATITVIAGETNNYKEARLDVAVKVGEIIQPPTETDKPEATNTPEPTETPVSTGTPDPTGTPIPTGTPDPTGTPVPTGTPEPTETPVPTETPEPTETPVPTETQVPTGTPIPTVTPVPTSMPEPTQNPGVTQPPMDTDKTGTQEQPSTVTVQAKGTTLSDTTSNAAYKVTKPGTVTNGTVTGAEVEYTKSASRTASITIPDTVAINGVQYKVTSIANNAFKNDKTLTKVKIGSNITTIGANAFSGCKNLKSVTIGKNVTTIKDKAFYNCVSVTKLTIPSKVKQIGKQAFSGCKKLKSVVIGKNVTNIGDKAFYKCTALTKLIIPSNVKKLGKQVFYGCKKLKTMTIKTSKLTSKNVGSNAFKGIYEKPTVKVPKKQLATYTKLLKAKGLPAKAVIKK